MKSHLSKFFALFLLIVVRSVLTSVPLHATPAMSFTISYAGIYNTASSYSQGNVVKYGNCTYLALGAIAANSSPNSNPGSWTIFGALPEINTFGAGTNTFTIDFVTIGNPGNANDTNGFGKVSYSYQIGAYAISQSQINAATANGLQGVTAGAWSGDQPACSMTWYQAAAFVNWLNTSQGYTPAYNLTYSNNSYSMTLWPTNQAWTNGGTNFYRNANCVYFLPSENEWYKAAYYDPNKSNSGGYWLYPTGSSAAPMAVISGTASGTAVFNHVASAPAPVTLAGGRSPYGTMGQGGNVFQWMESSYSGSSSYPAEVRVARGGDWIFAGYLMQSSSRGYRPAATSTNSIGFRVGSILHP